jgi:ABC-type Fe3+-hydroxamate transport system substrate-binding protein
MSAAADMGLIHRPITRRRLLAGAAALVFARPAAAAGLRVAVIGGEPPIIGIVAVLGAADALVNGYPLVARNLIRIERLMPQVARLPALRGQGAEVSLESLLALHPDLVITPDDALQTAAARLGVPLVRVRWDEPGFLRRTVLSLGRALGRDAQADAYLAYDDRASGELQARLAAAAARPRVLYCNFEARVQPTRHVDHWIRTAGGSSVTDGPRITEGVQFGAEHLLAWNPQTIVVSNRRERDLVLADATLRKVAAVERGAVFAVPAGLNLWCLPGAEQTLAAWWLAQQLHPALFGADELRVRAVDFYRRFLNVELAPDECSDILAGL